MNTPVSPLDPADELVESTTVTPPPGIVPKVPAREPTYTELKKRIHSHPAYRRRQRYLSSKAKTGHAKAVQTEADHYDERWLRGLSDDERLAMATWSKKRIALAIDDHYNRETDAGRTATSVALFADSIGSAAKYWRARAKAWHKSVQAEREALGAMQESTSASTPATRATIRPRAGFNSPVLPSGYQDS